MTGFDAGAVPDELREREQWVCWAEKKRNGKLTKIPKHPNGSGQNAKSSDMATWGSFEQAVGTARANDWGIGFVFSDAGPYVGLDLDHCLNDAGGPKEWLPSIDEFVHETYIEKSPSGDGVHILFEDVKIPSWWTNQEDDDIGGIELYDSGRFFTVTGEDINGSADTITDAGDLGGWLLEAWGIFNDELPRALRDSDDSKSVGTGDIDVYDVLSRASYPKGERVEHPVHGSNQTGANFSVDDNGETWRCWRDDCTGNAMHIIGMEAGIIDCGDWVGSGLDDDTWRDICDEAREQGYDIPEPSSSSEPTTDGTEVVESDEAESGVTLPVPIDQGLSVRDGGYGVTKQTDNGERWEEYSNFQLETNSFATDPDNPQDKRIDMTVHPRHGNAYDVVVSPTVFNEKRDFKSSVVTGLTTTFSGKENVLNRLKTFVGTQDAPERIGTYQMGLHGDEWVTPNGVLGADGWIDDPGHVHVKREISAERKWSLDPEDGAEYDSDAIAEIVETLPDTRERERFLPVIGWFYAAPLKPLVKSWAGEFNLLSVIGETGSGKTATLSTLWEAFGMEGDPMTADDTKFVLMTTLASSCAVPMWFDEYKPSDMRSYEVDQFWNEIRKTTRGGVSSRGNADGSTDEYHLDAPVVVSGEERVHGSAEERRGIFTTFRKGATEPGSESAHAYAKLTGGSAKTNGEIEYFEGLDLSQHALAYYRFLLNCPEDGLNAMWRDAARHVSELLAGHGIEGLEDLVEQGLQTIKFGLELYRWFGACHDADLPVTAGEIDDAVLYVATNVVGGVNRKTHLDVFLEVMGRAARHDYLEEGRHYKFVNEDDPEEELRFNLTTTFDKVARYAREHDVAEDLLNSADDYRERVSDSEGSDYVVETSIPTQGLNRCVGIHRADATESINGFQKGMFTDRDGVSQERATALRDLEPGYHDVTVRCVTTTNDTPDALAETGTLADATGVVDYVVWNRSEPVGLEEDEAYRIKSASVGYDPDGAVQLELNGAVCDANPIGDGVGHLSYADPEDNERIDTAADGGNGGYEQAKPHMKEILREHGPCEKTEWMAHAHKANIDPNDAEGAFESLKEQGQVFSVAGGWEVA